LKGLVSRSSLSSDILRVEGSVYVIEWSVVVRLEVLSLIELGMLWEKLGT